MEGMDAAERMALAEAMERDAALIKQTATSCPAGDLGEPSSPSPPEPPESDAWPPEPPDLSLQ